MIIDDGGGGAARGVQRGLSTMAAAEIAIGRVVDALKDPKGSLCIFTFSRGLCAISYVCCHLDISRGGHVCCNLKV
jgi:hypothetical protein